MDKAHLFLGMKIERDRKLKNSLFLKLRVGKFLSRFKLEGSSAKFPMQTDLHLRRADEDEQKTSSHLPYRKLVGSLMYLGNMTRPDLMFAVSELARYFSFYGREHWNAAWQVGKYASSTKTLSLHYAGRNEKVVGYTDADWAGDK